MVTAKVRRQRRKAQPSFRTDTSYMMRGMVDVSKMAVGGAVGIGLIGAAGSLIKK